MFQAQLRAFIPEMLKYSTGRGKPGWGKESCKPIWWPEDIPWANVRSDVRTEEQKQRVCVELCLQKSLLLCGWWKGLACRFVIGMSLFVTIWVLTKSKIPEYALIPFLTPPPPQTRQVSWTQALRTIVKNCYKQHGREDLLYAFEDQQTQPATATHSIAHLVPSQTVVQTFSNPDGTVSLIQVRVMAVDFSGEPVSQIGLDFLPSEQEAWP